MTAQLTAVAEGRTEADFVVLIAHLRVLVLRGAPCPSLVALLSPKSARVVQEGARLRARLPAYSSYCDGPSWTHIALCCCPHSGPWCTATWSSPLPRSFGQRGWAWLPE
jgi:hypothetical protein